MTLKQIEAAANRGDIAKGDFNIRHALRFEAIPQYYRSVGDVTWLRKNTTLSVTVSNQGPYSLPDDFRSMISIYRPDSSNCPQELQYIGENPLLVASAEITTAVTPPSGFYIVKRSDGKLRGLKLDCIPDAAYTFPYVYRSRLVFLDDDVDLELDFFIPEDYQQPLIEKLREYIMVDRYGVGDGRAQRASVEYDRMIFEITEGAHDLARRNHIVSVR